MPPKKSDKKAVKGKDQTAAKPKKTDSNSAPDGKSLKHKTEDRPKSETGKSKQALEVTEQQMNATKKIVQLPSYNSNQIKCTAKCGFFESIVPPGISVIIDRDIVELQGQDLKLLRVAKDEIEKCWKDMTHTCTSISIIPYQADLLTQPKVVEFINGYLDIENSSVTWDIVKVFDQGTLVVYAFDKKDAEDMQIRILSCIVEVCVKMKDTKLEWFQTLFKTKERRMIFTSNRYGDVIVYTTLDIFKKYFEGQTLSKSIKQPSNSDETKADNLTNSLGKVANWSGPPAHQSAATNLLTNLEQCSGGINPMKESQLDKKGEQDIQAPGTKEKKKEYSDYVSVSEQQVEYIDKSLKNMAGRPRPIEYTANPLDAGAGETTEKVTERKSAQVVKTSDIIPSHWFDMGNENFMKIAIKPGDDSFQNYEWENIQTTFESTLPQAKIVSIQRIQNICMLEHFYLKKRQFEHAYGNGCSNQLSLFHGTTPDMLDDIAKQNLDPRKAGDRMGARLGLGTYFVVSPEYSDLYAQSNSQGHKFIFVANVLAGKSCIGKTDYKRPPLNPDKKPRLFDSCVDNIQNPKIYCIFNDTQYYLKYLIEYT